MWDDGTLKFGIVLKWWQTAAVESHLFVMEKEHTTRASQPEQVWRKEVQPVNGGGREDKTQMLLRMNTITPAKIFPASDSAAAIATAAGRRMNLGNQRRSRISSRKSS